MDDSGDISPSAFIPFCSFGGNLSLVGTNINNFQETPVCTAFKQKIVNDQVCYEIDVNRFKADVDWEESLQLGLSLVLDTNNEYDVSKLLAEDGNIENNVVKDKLNSYDNTELHDKFTIYLKTISMYNFSSFLFFM